MSCRRAFEIDLAAFVAEPARPEHAGFRAHYPQCAACADEVSAWTELEAALHGLGGGHPEPALLLRFEERDANLGGAERAAVEAHLARCASCRDELASLRAFPFEQARAPEARAHRTRPPGRRSRGARVRAALLHPAFAYAVVALLAWPAARGLLAPAQRSLALPATAPAQREVSEFKVEPEGARKQEPPAEQGQATAVVTSVAEPRTVQTAAKSVALEERVEELVAKERRADAAPRAPAAGAAAELAAAAHKPLPSPAPRAATPAARLRIELPRELAGERELVVRVRDDSELRELRERVQPEPGASAIELALPEDWPPSAHFEVEIRGTSDAERVFRQTLTR